MKENFTRPNDYKGIFPALCTPTDGSGNIDIAKQLKIIDECKKYVHGFCVGGTTALLGFHPFSTQIDNTLEVLEYIGEDIPVIIGFQGQSAIQKANFANTIESQTGRGWTFMNKPTPGLKPSDAAIREEDSYLINTLEKEDSRYGAYDVPGRVVIARTNEHLIELSKHPRCIFYKDARGSIDLLDILNEQTKPTEWSLGSGDDHIFNEFIIRNLFLFISAPATVAPKAFRVAYDYVATKDSTIFLDISPELVKQLEEQEFFEKRMRLVQSFLDKINDPLYGNGNPSFQAGWFNYEAILPSFKEKGLIELCNKMEEDLGSKYFGYDRKKFFR